MGGQPPLDTAHAPMISSVQTRALADARGAYLAGNLDALLARMGEAQQQRFHQAVVRQALACVERYADRLPREQPIAHCLAAIRRWLAEPSPQHADLVRTSYDAVHRLFHRDPMRHVDWREWKRRALDVPINALVYLSFAVISRRDAPHSALIVARRVAEADIPSGDEADRQAARSVAQREARRWQIEAAWAILQHRDPPAPDLLP